MSSIVYPVVPYFHDEQLVTLYDIQEVIQEGRKRVYIISISDRNVGLGFANWQTWEGIAQEMAENIRDNRGYNADEITLYQQRPDDNFDKVSFREIERNGRSELERETRTTYTRNELEYGIGETIEARVIPTTATFGPPASRARVPKADPAITARLQEIQNRTTR